MTDCSIDYEPIDQGRCIAAKIYKDVKGQCIERQCNSVQWNLKQCYCQKHSKLFHSNGYVKNYTPMTQLFAEQDIIKYYKVLTDTKNKQELEDKLTEALDFFTNLYYKDMSNIKQMIRSQVGSIGELMLYHIAKLSEITDRDRQRLLLYLEQQRAQFENSVNQIDLTDFENSIKEMEKTKKQIPSEETSLKSNIKDLNAKKAALEDKLKLDSERLKEDYNAIFHEFLQIILRAEFQIFPDDFYNILADESKPLLRTLVQDVAHIHFVTLDQLEVDALIYNAHHLIITDDDSFQEMVEKCRTENIVPFEYQPLRELFYGPGTIDQFTSQWIGPEAGRGAADHMHIDFDLRYNYRLSLTADLSTVDRLDTLHHELMVQYINVLIKDNGLRFNPRQPDSKDNVPGQSC
jgi:hypothetical protein